MIRVLSLGVGVQSSTMALMAHVGALGPKPDVAVFADTGWEPLAIYDYLAWLEATLSFPVVRRQRAGLDLGEYSIATAQDIIPGMSRGPLPPWYLSPEGMLPKQCSKEFKARVVQMEIRERLGLRRGQHGPKTPAAEQWMGISTDEAARMKPCEKKYIVNRFPLIEQSMSRTDCLRWMADHKFPTPQKSSCIFCPYRGDAQYAAMKRDAPADWIRLVAFDRAIRPGYAGLQGEAFVHRSRLPIDQVVLKEADTTNHFINECEGHCGL